jgi:hypothetical protein
VSLCVLGNPIHPVPSLGTRPRARAREPLCGRRDCSLSLSHALSVLVRMVGSGWWVVGAAAAAALQVLLLLAQGELAGESHAPRVLTTTTGAAAPTAPIPCPKHPFWPNGVNAPCSRNESHSALGAVHVKTNCTHLIIIMDRIVCVTPVMVYTTCVGARTRHLTETGYLVGVRVKPHMRARTGPLTRHWSPRSTLPPR